MQGALHHANFVPTISRSLASGVASILAGVFARSVAYGLPELGAWSFAVSFALCRVIRKVIRAVNDPATLAMLIALRLKLRMTT